jgi:hypothetical protein
LGSAGSQQLQGYLNAMEVVMKWKEDPNLNHLASEKIYGLSKAAEKTVLNASGTNEKSFEDIIKCTAPICGSLMIRSTTQTKWLDGKSLTEKIEFDNKVHSVSLGKEKTLVQAQSEQAYEALKKLIKTNTINGRMPEREDRRQNLNSTPFSPI